MLAVEFKSVTGINGYIYNEKQCVTVIFNSNVGTAVIKGITVASVPSLQSPRVCDSKLDAPETNCFVTDYDPSLGEKIFNEWSDTPGAW